MPKGKLKCLSSRVPVAKAVRAPNVNTDATRLTGSRWLDIRRRHLANEPLCRKCIALGRVTAGDEIDHITPILEGGHPTHEDNLQTLCIDHHREKTAAEVARRNQLGVRSSVASSKEVREERLRLSTARKPKFQ